MTQLKYEADYTNDFYDLSYALKNNNVTASSQIAKPLACLVGENDEKIGIG